MDLNFYTFFPVYMWYVFSYFSSPPPRTPFQIEHKLCGLCGKEVYTFFGNVLWVAIFYLFLLCVSKRM